MRATNGRSAVRAGEAQQKGALERCKEDLLVSNLRALVPRAPPSSSKLFSKAFNIENRFQDVPDDDDDDD